MKLGFIILAHNQPDAVRRQVDFLAGAGHKVIIHFDKNAPATEHVSVRALEQTYPGQVHVVSRVHCVWGEWSLVEAVLVALREFERMPEKPEYIHLMSGADFPIRPIADLEEFLRRNPDKDFIECCDVTQRRWVKGGLSLERFRFFFPVNFRTSRKTFDRLVRWHRKLHIRRSIPLDMTPHMGSQWWTLRWSSCGKILDFLKKNPGVIRYFRSTWIPDESFFQTVLAHLVPRREIADLQLILHHLTPTGRPYVVHPDHLTHIGKLPHFFVRKVSAAALNGIESLARSRRSPIPRPAHLARIHSRVRDAIDQAYEHSIIVPGHPHGAPIPIMRKSTLVFLTDNHAETALVRAHVAAHAGSVWCGRPLVPDIIDLSDEILAATGFTRSMTMVRDKFPEQFVDTIASSLPDDKAAVFVVQAGDGALPPTLLARIPGVQFTSFHPRPNFQFFAAGQVRYIPERRISRLLDETAPGKSTNSSNQQSSFVLHAFGRIGNYFHLDATLLGVEECIALPAFLLPGVADPVSPETIFTHRDPSGGTRLLLFFWVDDGTYLDICKQHPAHLLLNIGETVTSPPLPLLAVRESRVSDIIDMLQSFDDDALWAERLVLKTVACAPAADRFGFILLAKPHWAPDAIDGNLAKIILPEESSSPTLIIDKDWHIVIENIQQAALHEITSACALAQSAVLSHDLPRREILRAIQPCLPRDSRWWPLSLGQNDELGDAQIADALNCAGSASADQGCMELAELCFQAAHRIDPTAQSVAWNLGLLLASQNRNGEAKNQFHSIHRHYANESIASRWPTLAHVAWPAHPWPTYGYALPDGTSSWPRISIVTPSYNQAAYIEETILSVLHQNYPNLQYIVVDGASTDGTREVLEKYRSRIDHLVIEPDDGQTQAINKGFRLADGEIVAWLNSDDMYAPGTLHLTALHWLASRADVLAGICAEHRDRAFAVINKPRATNRDFNPAQLARIFPYWFSGMYFFQPEVFFTKALLDRVGPLDESLHYAMDYDLWMRFAKDGAQLEVIDWPFAFFRLHDAQKTTQSIACIAEQCAVRNRHHPLELREERRHQMDRQLATLRSKSQPVLAILGPHFQVEASQAAEADSSLWLATGPDDAILATAHAALVLIGSQRLEIPLLQQLRATYPDLLLVGWFLDHDHDPHANHEAALFTDIILPTNMQSADYLRSDSAIIGPEVSAEHMSAIVDFLMRPRD
jgi:hypothetical protein